MGKKKILPDYLKGTTVGGGVQVYNDDRDWETLCPAKSPCT